MCDARPLKTQGVYGLEREQIAVEQLCRFHDGGHGSQIFGRGEQFQPNIKQMPCVQT